MIRSMVISSGVAVELFVAGMWRGRALLLVEDFFAGNVYAPVDAL